MAAPKESAPAQEGKYLYCIAQGSDARNLGRIGIGERGDVVTNVNYRDLSAFISNSPMTKYTISRENLTAHEKVTETIMKDYKSVLPVRFCTIATCAEEIRSLLRKRYVEFKNELRRIDNKIELGLKAWWKDMDGIFVEIVRENEEIARLKQEVAGMPAEPPPSEKVRLGEMVHSALELKREHEASELVAPFRKLWHDAKTNKATGDQMVLNAVFLVDRIRGRQFDNQVEKLEKTHGERYRFSYIGPAPPFNFVNIEVDWK